eukprot:jgi/Chlat1/2174/Chrsp17S02749
MFISGSASRSKLNDQRAALHYGRCQPHAGRLLAAMADVRVCRTATGWQAIPIAREHCITLQPDSGPEHAPLSLEAAFLDSQHESQQLLQYINYLTGRKATSGHQQRKQPTPLWELDLQTVEETQATPPPAVADGQQAHLATDVDTPLVTRTLDFSEAVSTPSDEQEDAPTSSVSKRLVLTLAQRVIEASGRADCDGIVDDTAAPNDVQCVLLTGTSLLPRMRAEPHRSAPASPLNTTATSQGQGAHPDSVDHQEGSFEDGSAPEVLAYETVLQSADTPSTSYQQNDDGAVTSTCHATHCTTLAGTSTSPARASTKTDPCSEQAMTLHAVPSPSRTSKVPEAATPVWQSQRVRLPCFLHAFGASPATQQQNTQEESNQQGFYLTAGITQQGNATPLPQHTCGGYFTGGDNQKQHHPPSPETATSPAAQHLQVFYEHQAVFGNLDAAVANRLAATVADMFNLDDKDAAEDMALVQPVKRIRVQDGPPVAGSSGFRAVNRLKSFAEQASAGNTVPQNPGGIRLFEAMSLRSEVYAGEDQQASATAACPKTSELNAAEQTILEAAHEPQDALGKDDGIQLRAGEPNRMYMHGAAASGCQGAATTLTRVDSGNRQFVSDVQRRSASVPPSSSIGPIATNIAATTLFTTSLGRQLPPASPTAIKRVQAILQEVDGTEAGDAHSLKRLAHEGIFQVPPAKRLAALAAPAVNTGNAIAGLLTTASGKALAPASSAAMRRAQEILDAVGKANGADHALNGKPSNSGQQVAGQPGRAPSVCLPHADRAVTSAATNIAVTSLFTTGLGRQLPPASPTAIKRVQAILQEVDGTEAGDARSLKRLAHEGTFQVPPAKRLAASAAPAVNTGNTIAGLLTTASGKALDPASPAAMRSAQAILDAIGKPNGVDHALNGKPSNSGQQVAGQPGRAPSVCLPHADQAVTSAAPPAATSMLTTGGGRQLLAAIPAESPATLQEQQLSTAKAYKAEPIRSTMIVSALGGRPRRRFITPTSALRLQTRSPNEPDDSSSVAAEHAGHMSKPVRWTLHDMYASRAKRIPLVEFFEHAPQDSTLQACCDDKQIHLPAGSPLVNLRVKDSSGLQLRSADFREMLLAAGVDKNAASEHWVQNHFQWIVWKLASYEQSFPQYRGHCLTPSRVLDQLKYRYEREVHQGQRSVLTKMMEKDFPAAAPMVLCVSHITDLGSLDSSPTGVNTKDDHESAVRGAKALEATAGQRDKVASTAKPAVIEVTDGWYSLNAELDAPLSTYLRNGKLCIGQKLQICNAVLLNSTEGLPPLEGCKTIYLRLHANSTRRAHWALKLGHGRQYFPIALRTAVAGGGMVPLTAIVVSRAYPLVYKERLPNGIGSIDRSARAEEHASRKFYARKAQLVEAVMQQHHLEMAKQAPAQQLKMDSGVALYEAAITAADQATFMAELTASQHEELSAYMREHEEEQRQLLQDRLQEALEEANLTERNVSPFLRLRVHGLVRTTDLQAEQDNDDDTMLLSRGGEALITVWRPSPEQVEQLQEGRAFWVRSLVASNWNDTHPSSLTGVTPVVHLNTCRQTSWTTVNATALNQFRFWQESRVATRVCELQGMPIGREFDIVAWVLHVGEQTTYGERSQQWVFLADDSCDGGDVDPDAGGEVDLLAVELNAPVDAFTPLEASCQGTLLAFGNLMYRCRDSSRGMQNAAVMDVTGITAFPKAQHLASSAAHLKPWAAAQYAELLGMRKRVLRALGLNEDTDISADQTDAATLDTPHNPLPMATRVIVASIIAINKQEQRSTFTASLHLLKLGAVGDIAIPASSLPKTPTPYLTYEVVLDDGVALHHVAASVDVLKAIFATLPITLDNIRSALLDNRQVLAQHPPAGVMRQCLNNLTVLRLTAPGSTPRRQAVAVNLADTLVEVLMNGVVFAEEWTSALETAISQIGDLDCGHSCTSVALLTRVQCLLEEVHKRCLDTGDGADKACIVDCALEDVKAHTEVGTGPIVGPVFLLASTWEAIRQVVLAALAQSHLKVTLHGMPGVGNSPAHWCVAAVKQQALCPLLNDWLSYQL